MLRRASHADSAARLRCSDRTATQTGSGCAEGAVTGSEAGGPNIRIVTIAGTQVAPHLPSRPRHTRCRCGCARRGRTLGRRRARHPSRQSFGTTRRIRLENLSAGSHLGSTLKPGGAVLTLGVFRRSRSVACIRADASPSEVRQRHGGTGDTAGQPNSPRVVDNTPATPVQIGPKRDLIHRGSIWPSAAHGFDQRFYAVPAVEIWAGRRAAHPCKLR
jgi:hypothetical protein